MSLTNVLTQTLLWLLVMFQGLLIVALLRQLQEIQSLLTGIDEPVSRLLQAGSTAPAFSTVMHGGRPATSKSLFDKGGLLIFLSSGCGGCQHFIETLPSDTQLPHGLAIVWLGELLPTSLSRYDDVITGDAPLLKDMYRIGATPTAVIVNANGLIAGYMNPRGYSEVASLLNSLHALPTGMPDPVMMPSSALVRA
jgi:hypothetical protein